MPYTNNLPDLEGAVKGKHILLDSDAIISCLDYKARDLFSDLVTYDASLVIIQPVLIELLNTNRNNERLERLQLIEDYKMKDKITLRQATQHANRIQEYLQKVRRYPSPTDIYLGATLASFNHNGILLCTSNISDFPQPLFKRRSGVVLENETSSKNVWFLSLEHSELNSSSAF